MGWSEVDDKLKRGIDSRFVSCTESYEKRYVVDTILDEVAGLKRENVEAAFDSCCKQVAAPRPREDFLACMQKKLD